MIGGKLNDEKDVITLKGAPEIVLKMCKKALSGDIDENFDN